MKKALFLTLLCLMIGSFSLIAQNPMAETEPGKIMITIFLKHNQELGLEEISEKLEETGFWKEFPPEEAEVVSWYVMMGIGQVVTVKIPAEKLRDLNLSIERNAWGAFFTEFYPTYDLWPVVQNMKNQQQE
ncbi:MAG: hypothetical protein ACNS62_05410 [Candidatus Cyclobacteriaceae bacterium M3_2C_046]